MEQPKKVKKIKRQARLLDEKKQQIDLENYVLEYSDITTPDLVMAKSQELVEQLEDEEELETRLELELRLEALKYVLDNMGGVEVDIDDTSYPETGDPNFSLKISRKQEFNQYKIDNEEWSSENLDDISSKCSWRDLSQTQKFLQNFISPMTPYNGLLLFHGVGVGKTCSSITIAEGFKEYLEEKKKKVYVLLKPTIRENYKKSIIDLGKVNMADDNQCTGDTYFEEMGKSFVGKNIKKKDELKKLERKANRIINRYYDFYGYGEFVSIYKNIEDSIKVKDKKERLLILRKKLREKFSDSVIIIDEAHNITPRDKMYGDLPKRTTQGGGAYNDFTEGLTLTKGESEGKEVSGVLMKIIKMVQNMKLILLSATPMYNEAPEIVYLLNLLLANDKKPLLNASKMFTGGKITDEGKAILRRKTTGYVSYLRSENPINYPYKLDPVGRDVINVESLPGLDMKGNRISDDKKVKHLSFINCPMSGLQLEVYRKYFDADDRVNAFDTVGSQICNIVYNQDVSLKEEEIESIDEFYSDRGFKKILKLERKKYNFTSEDVQDYFKLENLRNVAPKIAKIVENVNKSHGINFVYSQFKNSGVFPLAFALEMEGYVNYDGSTLLNLPRGYPKKEINGKQAKYLLITGDSSDDFNKYKKEKEILNEDGSELKVILGTQAASEGLNIFNVRGIHILDPWHHLNRLEQIVGRGLRSCSHKNLPLAERNLTVFLYVVTYPENDKETLDIKMYRKAEEKTINVAEVQRELKTLAVDCHLNKQGNVYVGRKWETPIETIDLFGNRKRITIGDKPGSRICDYMDDCDYKCYGGELGEAVNDSTYSLEFSKYDIKATIKILKEYFKETKRVKSSYNDIMEYVRTKKSNVSKNILSKALYNIIERELEIVDRLNRKGTMIYRGKMYIFQPKGLSDTVTMIERRLPYRKRTKKLGLESLLKKRTKKKELETKITVKMSSTLFIELLERVKTHITKLGQEDNIENLKIIIEEVYDRLENDNKVVVLKNILEKMVKKEDLETVFNEGDCVFEFGNFLDELMGEFEMEGRDKEILTQIIDYILKNKFFKIQGTLGFKINSPDEMKYLKMVENKLVEVDDEEHTNIIVEYVNKLKLKKNEDRELSNIYGFMKEDKKGNISFKILEKKEGVTKTTQQSTGSTCSHFTIPKLKEMISKLGSSSGDLKGKTNLCDKISFEMRKLEAQRTESINFYGLDDYLELK